MPAEPADGGPVPAARTGPLPAAADAWLDVDQAALLLRVPTPALAALVADGVVPSRLSPSGRLGVMKADLLAWQAADRADRRAGLAVLAAGVDREVFG